MSSSDIIGILIIALIYFCLLIVVFAPTIYAVWFYLMGRKVQIKSRGLLRIAILTGCANVIVAFFLIHLASDYFLASKVAEQEALTMQTMHNAIDSQQKFFAAHGRYYPVGPVRGPYHNDLGLTVDKDVILEVVPQWDKAKAQETYHAYAMHVWGKGLLLSAKGGKVEKAPLNSEVSAMIKSKLLNSVK
jgi:hypothetical protein